jgi:hypothetical protein
MRRKLKGFEFGQNHEKMVTQYCHTTGAYVTISLLGSWAFLGVIPWEFQWGVVQG